MSSDGQALKAADQLLSELKGPPPRERAATMGTLKRVSYTHEAMIDLIITQPQLKQSEIAAHFGYTESWISSILASDAFQAKMAARREEIIDPDLKASIEERFRGLVIASLDVLRRKLAQPQVSDAVALRAAELGAKALGVGGHKPPAAPSVDRLEILAQRLIALNPNATRQERIIDGQVTILDPKPA